MQPSGNKYIYVYDTDQNQVIILDPETGEEIERRDDDVMSLLDYLYDMKAYASLRKFAVWCARQPDVEWKPIIYKMFKVAEEAIHGEVSEEELQQLHENTEQAAVSAQTIAVSKESLVTPLFLAARACINPNPYNAALEASRFYNLWIEMNIVQGSEKINEWEMTKQIHEKKQEVKKEQIDTLLELLSEVKNSKYGPAPKKEF